VVIDVAVKQPNAGIVRDHVHGFDLGGRERNYLGAIAVKIDNVAVPVRGVEVVRVT
jgi:hypothetical protein